MAVEFIRVKSKSTGHEYSLPAEAFDSDVYEKVRGAAEQDGIIVPPVLNENVGEVVPVEETSVPVAANTKSK